MHSLWVDYCWKGSANPWMVPWLLSSYQIGRYKEDESRERGKGREVREERERARVVRLQSTKRRRGFIQTRDPPVERSTVCELSFLLHLFRRGYLLTPSCLCFIIGSYQSKERNSVVYSTLQCASLFPSVSDRTLLWSWHWSSFFTSC